MSKEMAWKEAVIAVLREAGKAMHYTEIADEIVTRKLRASFGATPAATVSVIITTDINSLGEGSTFVRVARGEYILRQSLSSSPQAPAVAVAVTPGVAVSTEPTEQEDEETPIIKAFGMFWRRDWVHWKPNPTILGQQQMGAANVDFGTQRGVYLLYDRSNVIYAGRTTDQSLGARLFQHTFDRLNGRWDRFSWFGVLPVSDDGTIGQIQGAMSLSSETLVSTLEAVLIETLEPPQNRKRGDDLRAVEYLQVEDPKIKATKQKLLLEELKQKI